MDKLKLIMKKGRKCLCKLGVDCPCEELFSLSGSCTCRLFYSTESTYNEWESTEPMIISDEERN